MSRKIWFLVASFLLLISASLITYYLLPITNYLINVPLKTEPTAVEPEFAPLSISSIFLGDHKIPPKAKAEDLRVLIVTGDVIPARGVNIQSIKYGFTYPWQEVAQLTSSGDLTVINLEAPLLSSCPVVSTGLKFCGDKRHIEGLKFGGVDMVGLENNHITNFGFGGLNETIKYLEEAGFTWARRDHLATSDVRGVKFGMLAFNGIGESIDQEAMVMEIKKARPQVDILTAMFHWGKEYERLPKTDGNIAPDDPRAIAHLAVDAGVDLVLGNHPHWTQGVEIYNGHLIPYSHGNFIFDQMWSEETRLGVVGKYTFYKTELVDVSFVPVKIYDYAQPRILEGEEADAELKKMYEASLILPELDGTSR